jgi:hypothetical protein
MSWQQKAIVPPLVNGFEDIAKQLDSAATALDNTLGAALSLLDVAKALYVASSDPYAAAMLAVLDELQKLLDDIFNANVSYIVIHADYAERVNELTSQEILTFGATQTKRYDLLGNKLLTPRDIIRTLTRSLDDQNDPKRPQISTSGQVACLGMMVTAADIEGFLPLLDSLNQVIGLKELEEWWDKLFQSQDEVDPDDKYKYRTQKPDWEGKKLPDLFPILKDQQAQLQKMINTLRGYLTSADDAIIDLINIMSKKISTLQNIVADFKAIVEEFNNAIAATGVHTLSFSGTGGNELLKQEFRDPYLEGLTNNGYSLAVVFVAGGPGAEGGVTAINALSELLIQ